MQQGGSIELVAHCQFKFFFLANIYFLVNTSENLFQSPVW